MIALLLAFCGADSAGIGGFVKFNFPYSGDRASLLSQLTIVVKTPQGTLVDSAEVQPTGYWIVPTPAHRELIVSVRGPAGLVISPASEFIQVPFGDVNFKIEGFSIRGSIVTKLSSDELVHVAIPLIVEVTDGQGFSISNTSTTDGSFVVQPVPQGTYTVTVRDAAAAPKTVVVSERAGECDPILIKEWPQTGVVVFPEDVEPRAVKLVLSGAASKVLETQADGRFSIAGLSVGQYHLKSEDEDVVISPLSFSISAAKLPTPLSLTFEGIRVHGHVMLASEKPVKGAEVTLNPGNMKSVTNADGEFVFPVVKVMAHPKLDVVMPHYSFSVPTIPAIIGNPIPSVEVNVVNAAICGKVECPEAKLRFSGGIETEMTVTNGQFCVSAPVSQTVKIVAESECGFEHRELSVTAPTDLVKFARVKAQVSGQASCLGSCNTNTVLTLKNQQYEYSTKLLSNGEFLFDEVEFGKYNLQVSGAKNEVWKETAGQVVVDNKKVNIKQVAEQTAFLYNVTVSHEMKVKVGSEIIDLHRGLNLVKVQTTIIEPADCHQFKPVDLKTQQRIVTESIERTVVVNGDGKYQVFLNGVELSAPYKFSQKQDQVVTVEVKSEAPYFSEPAKLEVSCVDTCPESVIRFEVLRGVEFRGTITPPIEGIVITAISENRTIATAVTDAKGVYSLGSFRSNLKYTLTATKQGYKLSRQGNTFDFAAEKLSSIEIEFEHADNVDTRGILLSLSRADGFAQNVVTDSSEDIALISDLEAGHYFLKPIFKEHQFTPAQVSIDLKDGTTFRTKFSILRVKFGINGVVRRITGEPEPDVEIEAIHPNGDRQATVTDARGRFRIGDLAPNQTFTLTAKASATSAVDRVTPVQMKVKMGNEEYKGVKFLSMKATRSFDIFGELKIDPDFLPKMNVILMSTSGQVVERFAFPSKLSDFFYFTNLTAEKYNIIIANTDRQLTGTVTCPKQEVEFKYPQAHVEIVCETSQKNQPSEDAPVASHWRASIIAYVAVLVWIAFFNFERIYELIVELPLFTKKGKRSRTNKSKSE